MESTPTGRESPASAAATDWFDHPPGSHEIHVWRVDLDSFPRPDTRVMARLSLRDRERAGTIAARKDAHRFVLRATVQRLLMQRYTGRPIADHAAMDGGPRIGIQRDTPRLSFNPAAAGRLALFAFTKIGEVGIDVHDLAEPVDIDDWRREFATPVEVDLLSKLDDKRAQRAVHVLAARKEACSKAWGSVGSTRFKVLDMTPSTPFLMSPPAGTSCLPECVIETVTVPDGFVAAVAVASPRPTCGLAREGVLLPDLPDCEVRVFDLEPSQAECSTDG